MEGIELREGAVRGEAAARREARELAATWAARAAAMGWSKRRIRRLGLSPEAAPTSARAAHGGLAAELAAADRRLGELARLVGAARPGSALMRIKGLTERRREVGAQYAAIVEELNLGSSGSWLEERVDGGGSGDGGQMRRLRLVEVRDRAQAALGDHIAMRPVRKPRSEQGRDPRRPIPLRALVDMVCIADWSLEAVLTRYGWKEPGRKVSGSAIVRLRRRLEIGLDVIEAAWSGGQVATVGRPARICAANICTAEK